MPERAAPSQRALTIMSLYVVDFLVLIIYLSLILFLGWRAALKRRQGSEDYILASRTLTLPMFVATLVPSFYGGTLGVGEYTYLHGISNWLVQGVPYYAFALLYAWFLAGRIRIAPGLTLPDHLERVYGRPMAILAALLIFFLASPADELLMLGTLTRWITHWPLGLCLPLVAAACVSFLFFGGLRSDVWANRLQFIIMFGGFALILPFAYFSVSPEFLSSHLPSTHLSLKGEPWLERFTWFFIALWTFVDPAFHQRVCAAKNPRTARLGIGISVLFWFCFDFMTTTTGLYARAMIPNLTAPLEAYPALADRLLPPIIKGLFLAGVASSTLAALQTTSFVAAISIARDVAGRLWAIKPEEEERWIRWGLLVTTLVSVLVAWTLPSVIGIWYTVGSTIIPGLLIPLLSSYFQSLRLSPQSAFLCSLGGWLAACVAWALGSPTPFYFGLAVSMIVWVLGKFLRNFDTIIWSNF
jgi:SSS family solute:Na+ symporter